MSTFKVPLTSIKSIRPHENANALDIVSVYDWEVVVKRGMFQVGDRVIYVPVDSILPGWLENLIFPPGSKITLTKSRIKAARIRGFVSLGMVISPNELGGIGVSDELETDMATILGITKYEPPAHEMAKNMRLAQAKKNPNKLKAFKEYTDVEHGKYYDRAFTEGELVVVTCKLHGTSARYGWFKTEVYSLKQRILNFLGLLPEWTFAWGSRRVQIQSKLMKRHSGFKSDTQGCDFGDVYTQMVKQYDLKNRIPKGYAVYGEIVGRGIQKYHAYGCESGEYKFYVYDVKHEDKFLDHTEMIHFCYQNNLTPVPVMEESAPFNEELVKKYLPVNPLSNEINEGIVVRPVKERTQGNLGRVVLKYINPEYYMLKDNTEFQ